MKLIGIYTIVDAGLRIGFGDGIAAIVGIDDGGGRWQLRPDGTWLSIPVGAAWTRQWGRSEFVDQSIHRPED